MIRFDGLPPEIVQAMCTPMHEVLSPTAPVSAPGSPIGGGGSSSGGCGTGALYIGSIHALSDLDQLRARGITHLVSVLDTQWLPQSQGFSSYKIQILDQATVDLTPHLEAACDHIDAVLKRGQSVLVHCQQGISRSAAIVIAYLIRNHGMSYEGAYALVRRKRACVKPNTGFVKALQEWETLWKRPALARRFTA